MSGLLDVRLFFWIVLPVLTGLATIYDPNPKRRQVWFLGGAAIILGSLFWFAG